MNTQELIDSLWKTKRKLYDEYIAANQAVEAVIRWCDAHRTEDHELNKVNDDGPAFLSEPYNSSTSPRAEQEKERP